MPNHLFNSPRRKRLALLAATCVTTGLFAMPPADGQVGSRNTLTAEPSLPRPTAKPVVVQLFKELSFTDFTPKPFPFQPQAGQPGAWAKIVLEVDFDVAEGRQYDRTYTLWIGGSNVLYGTTAEPSKGLPQRWHVERDLTEYRALFTSARSGMAVLGNVVDSTYTGIIHGSARLLFYPVVDREKAPTTADVVLPLAEGSDGGTVTLATTDARLAKTFTFPANVERIYMDVYAKAESKDEFWYTDLPSDVAAKLEVNPAPSLREIVIEIDGRPSALAPVYPLIFTGGMDPSLWRPIPGVHTLCFEPFRVDLTPFAGLLNDGKAHQVSLGVRNAKDYFSAAANLLLYLDPASTQVKGAVTLNTLGPLEPPKVSEHLTRTEGRTQGTVTVSALRPYRISGYVDTSHGRVVTDLEQTLAFENHQTILHSADEALQDIRQNTTFRTLTTVEEGGQHRTEEMEIRFPLQFTIKGVTAPDKSTTQAADVLQVYSVQRTLTRNGFPTELSLHSNTVKTTATALYDAKGNRLGRSNLASSQDFVMAHSNGTFYKGRATSRDGVVTGVEKGNPMAPSTKE